MTNTICLNMIVKNESKIIKRLLESVYTIIDTYCICDTGSTDNTIEIIVDFFKEKGITGKTVYEPFLNFSHNRNFALKECEGLSDYIIFLDADMVLQIKNMVFVTDFKNNKLNNYDSCHILQGHDDFHYQNMRIIKNDGRFKYNGVTHEYIDVPQDNRLYSFSKDTLFILDIGDGNNKTDKYERDIRLLTEALKTDENNIRYHFYLANSYHDSGKFEEAIETYKKRILLGGWIQEIWYSYYRIGNCYKNLNKMSDAIYYWMAGYNAYPDRVENLYEILHYYRIINKCLIAKVFYDLAKSITKKEMNRDNFLFLHNDIYTYKLDYEYSIIGYYLQIKNMNNEIINIFNNSKDANVINSLLSNMKFYKDILIPINVINLTNEIDHKLLAYSDDDDDESSSYGEWPFHAYSSSSCIINNNNLSNDSKYMMNIRYVNYKIDENGRYLNTNGHIVTINKYISLDKNLNVLSEKIFDEQFTNRTYIGCEDIRIFRYKNDDILFIGTGYHADNKIGIFYGKYDIDANKLTYNEIRSPNNEDCEKNWVFIDYKDKLHIIYKWYPLQIYKMSNINNVHIIKHVCNKNTPRYFERIRGSTNGFNYDNEIWFINHIVSYEKPRFYYHIISVFDKDMNLLRYSAPVKFGEECIEYTLGLVVESDRILISYSSWDRTTKIGVYDKKYIESKLCFTP